MDQFELSSPATRSEVLALIEDGDEGTRLLAGGTGLINLMKQRLAGPERLVSLHRVTDLGGIRHAEQAILIGALERLIDLEQHPDIRSNFPVLANALSEVASPRIRSMATIGGAMAHADPSQDTPLALMALDAVAIVESSTASREIPVDELYVDYYETRVGPNELITAVRLPLSKPGSRFAYKKFTPGSLEDYACVSVCIRLDLDGDVCTDLRIVLGGVGPTIFRATEAEALLRGKIVSDALIADAASAAMAATDPVDDTRGSAGYKRKMTGVWVKRTVERAMGERQ